MNPINWVIVAAILDVPLKLSYHQSQTVMKWQCLTAACCYVGFDMEQTLSDVYPRLTSRFRETAGSTFSPPFETGCENTRQTWFFVLFFFLN